NPGTARRCRARESGRSNMRPSSISETTRSRAGRRGSQKNLAAGPAAALDQPFTVGVGVIGQLFACLDPASRANPDCAVSDVDVAVGMAGVVDETRVVAADARVNHGAVGQLEAPDVAVADVTPFTLQALPIGNLLAGIMNDPRVLRNRMRCV